MEAAKFLILICGAMGFIVGCWEMRHAKKNPRTLIEPYKDPNQTGNSRTRAGMFEIFGK